jgi:hypothetical protein
MDHDELERQQMMQLLRDGDVALFNDTRKTNRWKRLDLRGIELLFANLAGVVLVEADLAESSLSGIDLSNSNLKSSFFTGCDLSGAEIRNADLTNVDLSAADLTGAHLTDSILHQANLSDASLVGANLQGVTLREADLRRADVRNANFTGADLLGADLDAIQAEPADYRNLGMACEAGGDRAVKTGQYENAMSLYDLADSCLAHALGHPARVELYRKLIRLANPLGLSREILRTRGNNLVLALVKAHDDAASTGDTSLASDLERLSARLKEEFGFAGIAAERLSTSGTGLSLADRLPYLSAAHRLYRRFDARAMAIRLGELVDALDETAGLDLTIRFHIPDLKLERPTPELHEASVEEVDLLRGKNLAEIVRLRLRDAICSLEGDVYRAWSQGEQAALEPLVILLHTELKLQPAFHYAIPLLAVYIVKSGLAGLCGWAAPEKKLGT